ncbi:LLM class flavin-dependent oxidoreductase [Cryobacterium sp. LW097]|uniref:LLM class flavin-dependent oxidoreductase n=1 Tax=unclassified Cryobacterium TaxID=2649013 RepID=UPI000B4DE485|nr:MULTISPECIES: LLM class flavin-dependent oxidoreductase [unclassified Cryobacterium]ASD21594.1 LLM class flavin-dependent oxidoreductase [Cryobacterium sp. LW097]TFC54988.1 LLM class flavin-dependent oxidoreductase [Cryobacterium sp. TMB3-1-2]TFC62587.1 LLM class flavin-dependent oxidoreductase [Cryobacterium sp. TMB1-7]TFC70332.1 LLM class flavin-dependent oxidoreductase [Cryobacterium sp. TMB3-15]TFC75673.1 LLM class flavin-dependent oxidoreductase [Cryobacterium sp. TMB3-10]
MRHGIVILPQFDWPEARRKWQGAEQYGFDHAWTYDHLSWRSLADQPWQATIPTLAAAAAVTDRIRLGTFVASPNFRHPVPFAKEVATVDDISGGRMLLGLGSGGTGFDAFVLGQPTYTPRQRHERFAEFVTDLDLLLRHEKPGAGGFDFAGDWFTAVDARMVGRPAQQPRVPFVIAANGPKGLKLVAEHGAGWVTTGADGAVGEEWWSAVAALVHRLEDTLAAADRAPGSLDRYLSLDSGGAYSLESVGAFDDAVGRAGELGFTDVISHWPRPDGIYAGSESVLDEVAARLT